MSKASVQAYKDLLREGKITKGEREIVKLTIRMPGITIPEMKKAINKDKNEFSGRLTGLRSKGIIYINGKIGPYSKYYFEPSVWARFEIRSEYENEVFVKWLKKAKDFEKNLTGDTMNELREKLKIQVQKLRQIA